MALTWEHPWLPRGKLLSFIIESKLESSWLSDIDSYQSGKTIKGEFEILKESQNYTFEVGDLLPSSHYVVKVHANSSIEGAMAITNISTPAAKPNFTKNIVVDQEITDHSITVILPPAPLYMTTNGTCFVLVTLLNGTLPEFTKQLVLGNNDLKLVINQVVEDIGNLSWIAAEVELKSTTEKFVVGLDAYQKTSKLGNPYRNRRLKPRSTYQVHVLAVNLMSSAPLFSYVSLAHGVETRDLIPPSGSSIGLLALMLLLIIPLLCWFAFVRYKKKKNQTESVEVALCDSQGNSGSVKDLKSKSSLKMQYSSKKSASVLSPEPHEVSGMSTPSPVQQMSQRMPVNMLEQYVRSALVTNEIQRQYEMIPCGSTQPCKYGSLLENKSKNRYGNLKPYDATRVVLKKLGNDNFSDYINANFVEGYNSPKFYIAAQGPKSNTVADFWRMIWQEEVKIVSMLTKIVENGKEKCVKYWPDSGKEMIHGDVSIETISTQIFADYTFSRLQVACRGETRLIDHLHFTSWPDHGVPLYALSVAAYLKKLLTITKEHGPILVHCSGGVGRTGTIILADINLRMAAAEGAVDVVHYLQKIREHRQNLVDNLDQYKLVHFVLLECLVEEAMDIPCDQNFKTHVQNLRDTGGLDRQFLHITRKKEFQGTQGKEVIERSPHLNRDRSIVSGFNDEIIFTQPAKVGIPSTHISAVYVDGFRMKNQFISTQFPGTKTLGKFWCLVLEKRISLIIVLNELDFSDKSTVEFRPSAGNSICPTPYIELKQNQLNRHNNWDLHFLHIVDSSNEDEPRKETIRLLQFKGWPSRESLPPSTNSLFDLWKEAERDYMGKGPILVTCRDGVTACGLFLALTFLIEKVKLEQVCDVYHAVQTVCQSRTKFMDTQDQFEYLYDAVTAYLEDFQTYANFQ